MTAVLQRLSGWWSTQTTDRLPVRLGGSRATGVSAALPAVISRCAQTCAVVTPI